MKYLVFLLLACVYARVTIIKPDCDEPICLDYLKLYVVRMNARVSASLNGARFVTTVAHSLPSPYVAGLYADAYVSSSKTIASDVTKYPVTDFTITTTSSSLNLNAALTSTDIQDQKKCIQVGTSTEYITRQCWLLIEYINDEQGMAVKKYTYSLTVKIPRSSNLNFVVIGNPILEIAKDVEIEGNVKYTTRMYRGSDCKELIGQGSSLQYGDDVCFEIRGDDEFTKSFEFEVGFLTATYSRTGKTDRTLNMLSVATLKYSLDYKYTLGQMYIVAPIMNIGRLNFAVMIFLNNPNRLLAEEEGPGGADQRKAMMPTLPGEFEVTDPEEKFIEDLDEIIDIGYIDSGSSIFMSLVTILTILALTF
jgi:hypothetical protein